MFKRVTIYILMILIFSGCAEWNIGLDGKKSSPSRPPQQANAYPFSDIPVPPDFSRNESKSWIYEAGSGNIKVARLFFAGYKKIDHVVIFYQNEMLNKGWALVNSIKTEREHIMNYQKEGWVSTIRVESNIVSTFIEIQAGPK
ncbi:MAG TPA: hypothetical protein HPP54_04155 [Nitrospinae bacterium]|nr:hypothetical protein [Nitrospinota bacterium]